MPAELSLRVGGVWLDQIGQYGEVVVTDRWPGCCYTLDWTMALEPGDRPPALMQAEGQAPPLVEGFVGSSLRWCGRLYESDFTEGTFSASGLYREGETTIAWGNDNAPTTNPGDAIFWARGRNQISWGALESFTPVADEATEPNYLSALMDEYALQQGRRWGVLAEGLVFTAEDWTDPMLQVYPSIADLGATRDGRVDRVYARFHNSINLNWETATAGTPVPGGVEEAFDLHPDTYGSLTPAQAQQIVSGYLAQASKAAWSFTNGLTLAPGMVTTPGGAVVDPAEIVARRPIRVHGLRDPRTGAAYTDFVIGESIWTTDDGIVQANPVQMVARDLESVLEDVVKGVLAA